MKLTFLYDQVLSKPLNPPPYQSTPNQQSYNPVAYTDARDNNLNENQSVNLFSSQHSKHGSVHPPRKPNTTTRVLGLYLIIAIILNIAVIFFFLSYNSSHEKIRREWKERERQALRDAWNLERKVIDMEREQWTKEQVDHENRQHREEEEKRALIVWENLTPSKKCLRYGTREYSATLAQVPFGLDPLKECRKKSINIHGRKILPSRCDTQVCLFNLHHPVLNLFFFSRECAGLLRATGSLISMNLYALHGGIGITTRYYYSIYMFFNLFLYTNGYFRAASNEGSTFVFMLSPIIFDR